MYLLYADHGIQMPLNKIPKNYSDTLVREAKTRWRNETWLLCDQAQKTLIYLNYTNINI